MEKFFNVIFWLLLVAIITLELMRGTGKETKTMVEQKPLPCSGTLINGGCFNSVVEFCDERSESFAGGDRTLEMRRAYEKCVSVNSKFFLSGYVK